LYEVDSNWFGWFGLVWFVVWLWCGWWLLAWVVVAGWLVWLVGWLAGWLVHFGAKKYSNALMVDCPSDDRGKFSRRLWHEKRQVSSIRG
jgi:hypothetical protein